MPHHTITNLQRHLRQKFPLARHGFAPASTESAPDFDLRNPATFPCGGITEIIPAHPSAGLALLFASMLEHEPSPSAVPELALIDGRDSFDPASFCQQDCSKLLWIRCQSPQQSIQAADLILRDGNLPRVVIDLLAFPLAELRQIPSSSWHRLKQLIEANNLLAITLSPQALIPCARLRLSMGFHFTLDHLVCSRKELFHQFQITSLLHRKQAL